MPCLSFLFFGNELNWNFLLRMDHNSSGSSDLSSNNSGDAEVYWKEDFFLVSISAILQGVWSADIDQVRYEFQDHASSNYSGISRSSWGYS